MAEYLNKNGVEILWGKIKDNFVTKEGSLNSLKPVGVNITINSNEWSNGSCTKDIGVDSKYYCQLGVPISEDTTNLINVSSANIIVTNHTGNNMTFKCLGTVPTSSITLELTVFYTDIVVIDKNEDYFNITEAELNTIFN